MIALILLGENYQVLEFWYPYLRLKEENIAVTIIGQNIMEYYSEERYPAKSELRISDVDPKKYDILIIPGGDAPKKLKLDDNVINLVRNFNQLNKPIASICHGADILIAANIVNNSRISCAPDLEQSLVQAGGHFVNEPVTVDGNFITSRFPDDLPQFMQAILSVLGIH